MAPAQFMALWILGGKGEVQIMPFWKLSGKCHFLIRFCTRNWSETYMSWFVNLNTFLWYSQVWQSNEIRHWLSPLAIRSNNKSRLMETFLWWKVMKRFHRWFQSMKSLHDHSLPFIIPISRFLQSQTTRRSLSMELQWKRRTNQVYIFCKILSSPV